MIIRSVYRVDVCVYLALVCIRGEFRRRRNFRRGFKGPKCPLSVFAAQTRESPSDFSPRVPSFDLPVTSAFVSPALRVCNLATLRMEVPSVSAGFTPRYRGHACPPCPPPLPYSATSIARGLCNAVEQRRRRIMHLADERGNHRHRVSRATRAACMSPLPPGAFGIFAMPSWPF